MSQTTTPSGAEDSPLLAMTVAANMIRDRCPCPCPTSCEDCDISRPLRQARAAVAALIARNAELEAQNLILAKLLSGYHDENKALRAALSELHDIVQGVLDERREAVAGLMDSFTLQPAAEALARTPATGAKTP